MRIANRTQAAEHFGVSLVTVTAWIRRGAPVVERGSRGRQWRIDLDAVAAWRDARQTGDSIGPLIESRAKRISYEADMAELEFNRRLADLLPRDEVVASLARAQAIIVQAIGSFPDEVARRCGLGPAVMVEIKLLADEITHGVREKFGDMSQWPRPSER